MTITHRFTRGWTPGSGLGFSRTTEKTADGENNRIVPVAAGVQNKAVALTIDVSQLKGLALLSDKAVKIETNSSSVPANIFNLAAGVPVIWFDGDPALLDTEGGAVTTDVTQIFITNDGDEDAEVQIGVLVDATV
ncbi:MAG: hypothetical protein ABMA13_20595 [Chthoniobacteraceae bacterium]